MTTQFTPAQLEAWAGCTAKYPEPITQDLWNERVALFAEAKQHAPALARLVLEKEKEIARLKGLAWIAFHEFNAINARSGGPLDQYGMVTVTHEYWQAITDLFAKAAGETTPWPTENAKAIFEEINRQAMKETSDDLF